MYIPTPARRQSESYRPSFSPVIVILTPSISAISLRADDLGLIKY